MMSLDNLIRNIDKSKLVMVTLHDQQLVKF